LFLVKDSAGSFMAQSIEQHSCEFVAGRGRLSILMQLQALLLLARPYTHTNFQDEWRQASSVAAKGYAPPRLTWASALWVPTSWALEKNSDEHEDYLEAIQAEASRLEQTRYVQEIQMRQHRRSLATAMLRAEIFRDLVRSIEKEGIRRPIHLVDVTAYDLPYRMFRLDGHHRAICARHLGLDWIPAFVFTVTPPETSGPRESRD